MKNENHVNLKTVTLPETNMTPENTPLEKEKRLQTTNVWVQNVSFRGCRKKNYIYITFKNYQVIRF